MSSSYLALEIPDDRLVTAIAEEAVLRDRDLDQIEAALDSETDHERAAAIALALGRAGRAASIACLERARSRCASAAVAISLAIDLLAIDPLHTERADRGYRFTAAGGDTLYVEDPIAAHWHAQDRWGPPLRPDPSQPALIVRGDAALEDLERAALEGRVLLAHFAPRLGERVHPVLRLTLAGFARTPRLSDLVRWREVASFGVLEEGASQAIACERTDGTRLALGHRPLAGGPYLVDLMGRLLMKARS